MSNHEFIDIASCDHPLVNAKEKVCLVCGQNLTNFNLSKYRKASELTGLGGHNH